MSVFTWLFPNLADQPNLPALGEEDRLQIKAWLVAEGDSVLQGQPLVRIETEDVSLNLHSPVDGRLKQITTAVGQQIRQGQSIALFELEEL